MPGKAEMGVLCSLDSFLLSRGVDIFRALLIFTIRTYSVSPEAPALWLRVGSPVTITDCLIRDFFLICWRNIEKKLIKLGCN